ncbi:MAG: Riboflavin kinase [Bacteroidota bacterium]|jgi:riboflavin kinase/FMN adenylyltransferase
MKCFYSFDTVTIDSPTAVTIGMFDGLHLGHLKVIEGCLSTAQLNQLKTCVITFSNHPADHFTGKRNELLMPMQEKIEAFKNFGIDYLVIIPFDSYIVELPAKNFIQEHLIERLKAKNVVLGYDNHFGKNREGSISYINEHFSDVIETISIDVAKVDEVIVSSSQIKKYLSEGDITKANAMLGLPFSVSGNVVHGNQNGRKIGFPTANMALNADNKFIPQLGVYLCRVHIEAGQFYGLTNMGYRPTLNKDDGIHIETHLLDFDGDIYGQRIEIQFIEKIRSEKRFDSFEDLKNQIAADLAWAKLYLA